MSLIGHMTARIKDVPAKKDGLPEGGDLRLEARKEFSTNLFQYYFATQSYLH